MPVERTVNPQRAVTAGSPGRGFTAWGVAADLTTPMVAGFKRIFDMSTFQASLVQLAYFGAYACAYRAAYVAASFTST